MRKGNASGSYVFYKDDWWYVVSEEGKDSYVIELKGKQKRVSDKVLREEIKNA